MIDEMLQDSRVDNTWCNGLRFEDWIVNRTQERVLTPMKVKGAAKKITITVTDEDKKPAIPAGLDLHAYPGGKLALTYQRAGVYTATLPAPKSYHGEKIFLRLSWSGGDLANTSIPVLAPPKPRVVIRRVVKRPPPPRPKGYEWPEFPSTTEWSACSK